MRNLKLKCPKALQHHQYDVHDADFYNYANHVDSDEQQMGEVGMVTGR